MKKAINVKQIFQSEKILTRSKINSDSEPEGFNLFFRALLGVSLIFNIALLIKFFSRRNK